jgi:YidC/Oxa1 family membrane protein insertase
VLETVLSSLHALLRPAEDAVAGVLVHLHDLGAPWPLAIVVLVVLARTLLLPLFVAQQRSLAALHREAGVHPLAGCLPGLLQSPVFLALTLTLESGETLASFGSATLAGAPLAAILTQNPEPTTVLVAVVLLLSTAALQVVTMRASTTGVATPTALLVAIPVVVVFSAAHFPIGVLLYWATSGAWSAGQQLLARRSLRRR